jgi:hypothetical protein
MFTVFAFFVVSLDIPVNDFIIGVNDRVHLIDAAAPWGQSMTAPSRLQRR